MTRLEAFVLMFTALVTAVVGPVALVLVNRLVKQTQPNGGKSLRDTLDNMLAELRNATALLRLHGDRLDETEALAAHDRRHREHLSAEVAALRQELDDVRSHHP